MDDLSTLKNSEPAHRLIDKITVPKFKNAHRFRALDPTGKDRDLLQSIADPKFRISGLTNKALRQKLSSTGFGKGKSPKQLRH